MALHLLRGILLLVIVLLIIIIIVLIFFLLVPCLLGIIFLLFLRLLNLAQSLPFFREGVCLRHIIRDNDVVENRASFYLPEIKANKAEVGIFINQIIILVLWIGNLFGLPAH